MVSTSTTETFVELSSTSFRFLSNIDLLMIEHEPDKWQIKQHNLIYFLYLISKTNVVARLGNYTD